MRKKIVAGNWKMNCTYEEGTYLVFKIMQAMRYSDTLHIIAPPYFLLKAAHNLLTDIPNLKLAAQNCHPAASGAYTGEISLPMLKSVGVEYVIVGHSERREYFHETNADIAAKVKACLEHAVTPIFCCGEPLAIREANTQESYVAQQLEESLFQLSLAELAKVVIAYEPIWAIGTGKTATAAQAQDMHAFIRKHIAGKYSEDVAQGISILYGGSCKPSNAKEIFSQPDVDGGLIGGASLHADDFVAIANAF